MWGHHQHIAHYYGLPLHVHYPYNVPLIHAQFPPVYRNEEILGSTGQLNFPENLQCANIVPQPFAAPQISLMEVPGFLDSQDIEVIEEIVKLDDTPVPQSPQKEICEASYMRDVVMSKSPLMPQIEDAVGELTEPENVDLLRAEAMQCGIRHVDDILLEALRVLSVDPSLRKLQAALDAEAEILYSQTKEHQPNLIKEAKEARNNAATDKKNQKLSKVIKSSPKCTTGSERKMRKVIKVESDSCTSKEAGVRLDPKRKKREKTSPTSQKLLKQWLFAHSYHPYPNDEEKSELCYQTNLTLQQLNNWFINARRRILPSFVYQMKSK